MPPATLPDETIVLYLQSMEKNLHELGWDQPSHLAVVRVTWKGQAQLIAEQLDLQFARNAASTFGVEVESDVISSLASSAHDLLPPPRPDYDFVGMVSVMEGWGAPTTVGDLLCENRAPASQHPDRMRVRNIAVVLGDGRAFHGYRVEGAGFTARKLREEAAVGAPIHDALRDFTRVIMAGKGETT